MNINQFIDGIEILSEYSRDRSDASTVWPGNNGRFYFPQLWEEISSGDIDALLRLGWECEGPYQWWATI